jgi:hypothetical protein
LVRDARFSVYNDSLSLMILDLASALLLAYLPVKWEGMESHHQPCLASEMRQSKSDDETVLFHYFPLNTKLSNDLPIRCSATSPELHASRALTTAS